MKKSLLRISLLGGISLAAYANTITFNTFVSGPAISAVEGQNSTIGFTYAGDKFVGTVYFGTNNLQLYSTNLTGGNVQKFGAPLPTGSGEIVVAGSLGQGGFGSGTVYAGTGGDIYRYSDTGGTPTLFATGLGGGVRGMLFDPGSTFGGDLLVTTTSGNVYKIDSAGTPTLLANTGEDTEGMDIIPAGAPGYGAFAGDVLTASEGSGTLRLIDPAGHITVATLTGATAIPSFETVNFVPLDLGVSGNPLEGYYAADYAVDIQKATAAQFAGLQGDLIATSEDTSNARVWDLHHTTGSTFSVTLAGNLPNQAEDGIFVTTQRINDTSPEPGTMLSMGCGAAVLAFAWRRRNRQA
jgi:hypothetical protein